MTALERPASELTVMDVYDIAAVLGQEFERIVDRFGCEALIGVVPKVVRVLELLEALVSRGATGQEAEELRRELDRLRQERSDRSEQDRKHQQELELVEDVWRGEVQDLHSQISQLQAENKRVLGTLSLKQASVSEDELQKQEGMSENERQAMKTLKALVDKQKDEIRAKQHELTRRREDIEALQMQQHRLMRLNQDLRHRSGVMEAQGKTLIQQRAKLEAAAHARQQELMALQLEVTRLRKEIRDWELEREVTELEHSLARSLMSLPSSPHMSSAAAPSNSTKPNSVWEECGEDPVFLASCDKSPSFPPTSTNGEKTEGEADGEKDTAAFLLVSSNKEPEEETDSLEQESDKPCFTLQELRDVLQERNELKAEVFMLQEELGYYKSEEFEDDITTIDCAPASCSSTDQPESGIRRLIFTAIMPMVAAGLIADDPTLLPIRRLVSFV